LLWESLVYGTSDFLMKSLGLVVAPLLTRLFTPKEYGLLTLINALTILLGIFLALGVDLYLQRMYFHYDESERRRAVSTGFFTLLVWVGSLFAAEVALFHLVLSRFFPYPGFTELLALSLGGTACLVFLNFFKTLLRLEFRPGAFLALTLSANLIGLGLGLSLIAFFDGGLHGYYQGYLASYAAFALVGLGLYRRRIACTFWLHFLKDGSKFFIHTIPAMMAHWIFGMSDRLMVEKLLSVEEVGRYSLGYSVASLLSLVVTAVGMAWSPVAYRLHAEDPAFKEKYAAFLELVLAAFSLFAVGVALAGPWVIRLLFTPEYHSAVLVIGPLALGIAANATTLVTLLGITISKRTYLLTVFGWSSAVLNVACNLMLIPALGITGAAVSTAASNLFLAWCYLRCTERHLDIVFSRQRILSFGALTLVFCAAASAALHVRPLEELIVPYALGACVYAALFAALRPFSSRAVRNMLAEYFHVRL